MHIDQTRPKTNFIALTALSLVAVAGVFITFRLTPTSLAHSEYIAPTVEVGNQRVVIPEWKLFATGNLWSLTSSSRPIPLDYRPTLVPATVSHVQGDYQIAPPLASELENMFASARSQGINLMLSEAYRSAEQQQKLYDSYIGLYGREYVQETVAVPGTSEHQTGLAVDLANLTEPCLQRGQSCGLDAPAIAWLRTKSYKFGFIERYPEGKRSITGVKGEHWHYRYVGPVLAEALTKSDITLDEFVQQAAPGYSTIAAGKK